MCVCVCVCFKFHFVIEILLTILINIEVSARNLQKLNKRPILIMNSLFKISINSGKDEISPLISKQKKCINVKKKIIINKY